MDFVQDNACVSVDLEAVEEEALSAFLKILSSKTTLLLEQKKLQTPQTHMSYSSRTGTSYPVRHIQEVKQFLSDKYWNDNPSCLLRASNLSIFSLIFPSRAVLDSDSFHQPAEKKACLIKALCL